MCFVAVMLAARCVKATERQGSDRSSRHPEVEAPEGVMNLWVELTVPDLASTLGDPSRAL